MDSYEGMGTDLFWLLEIFKLLDLDVMCETEEAIEMLGDTLILTSLLYVKEIKIYISS